METIRKNAAKRFEAMGIIRDHGVKVRSYCSMD